ncbi:unnamed protein product, partial [marine sediment metagenome]
INIFFYLDKRRRIVHLTLMFVILNAILSFVSIELGVLYFGFGYAISLLITVGFSLYYLDKDFEQLEYQTYSFQS